MITQERTALHPAKSRLRKLAASPTMMHYNRLAALVLAVNLVVGYHGAIRSGWFTNANLRALSTLVVANLTIAVLIRQQHVINLLFRIATSAPVTWPLRVRRVLAKVYHFGGVHVGAAVSATVWYLTWFTALVLETGDRPAALVWTGSALAALLIAIIITSLPGMRTNHHDLFERMHRFGGWGALALFWVQTLMTELSGGGTLATAARSGRVWALVVVTVSIALPWLRLRRVPVELDRPSDHVAIAHFDHGVEAFPGSSSALSRNPLVEWHAFANAPTPEASGFRITISRAGDWTGRLIDELPSHVWVKGVPTAGVANVEKLFNRVVYVTTGSGIGICLPHILAKEVPSKVVWAARNPRRTFGDALVDEILEAKPDTLIWDTDRDGKPDMVELAHAAWEEFEAEAVICISNKLLTWRVVSGMEERGIPAYGAIWDS